MGLRRDERQNMEACWNIGNKRTLLRQKGPFVDAQKDNQ